MRFEIAKHVGKEKKKGKMKDRQRESKDKHSV